MKVLLVCNAGMSTSMLMKKMQKYAEEQNIPLEIAARSVPEVKADVDVDVIMLGPQVSFQKDAVEKKVAGRVPVGVMQMKDYGRQNCPAIFAQIDELLGK